MDDLISRQAAIDAIENIDPSVAWLDYAADVIKALPSAQSDQRWIPVTERLPLYGQEVLAARLYGADAEGWSYEVIMAHIAVWNEETGAKWWNATNITHWMPLPEPPNGERKDDE